MDSTNAYEITTGSSVVERAPNPQIDEDSAEVQASEVSNTLNNSESSDKKSTKVPTKDGKPSLKRKNVTEESALKRKKTNPPTSQMVMESIKALKKRNGASVNAILEHMEGQYKVNAKLVKRYVTKYLSSAVEKGIVEKLIGAGNDERFKIKKEEKIKKVEQKLKDNQKMVKGEKVAKVGQESTDNKKIKAEKVAKVGKESNNKKIKAEKVANVEQKPNQKKAKKENVSKVK